MDLHNPLERKASRAQTANDAIPEQIRSIRGCWPLKVQSAWHSVGVKLLVLDAANKGTIQPAAHVLEGSVLRHQALQLPKDMSVRLLHLVRSRSAAHMKATQEKWVWGLKCVLWWVGGPSDSLALDLDATTKKSFQLSPETPLKSSQLKRFHQAQRSSRDGIGSHPQVLGHILMEANVACFYREAVTRAPKQREADIGEWWPRYVMWLKQEGEEYWRHHDRSHPPPFQVVLYFPFIPQRKRHSGCTWTCCRPLLWVE